MGKWLYVWILVLLAGCAAPPLDISPSTTPAALATAPFNSVQPLTGKLTLVEFFAVT